MRTMDPKYKEVNDGLVLIGISHRKFDATVKYSQTKPFIRRIKDVDNLLMEGTEVAQMTNKKLTDGSSYEGLALNNHTGKRIFLEEGCDHFDLLVKRGVPEDLIGFYESIRVFEILLSKARAKTKDSIMSEVRRSSRVGKKVKPSLHTKIDSSQVEGQFSRFFDFIMERWSYDDGVMDRVIDAGHFFGTYVARSRDDGIIIPGIVRYRSELEGKIAVVFGRNHVRPVYERLRDECAWKLLDWDIHVRSSDGHYRNTFDMLVEVVRL